jgi:hypothetical protein
VTSIAAAAAAATTEYGGGNMNDKQKTPQRPHEQKIQL